MLIVLSVIVTLIAGLLFLCLWFFSRGTSLRAERELIGWITLAANFIPMGSFALYTIHNPEWIERGRWYVLLLILFQFASLVLLGILIVRTMNEKIR